MFWRLSVLDRMRETNVGVITIFYFTVDGTEQKNYEFVGAGSDGGTWEWRNGDQGIEVAMTSNFTDDVVTVLQSPNWGSSPPVAQPWFNSATTKFPPDRFLFNPCLYLKRPTLSLEWRPINN